MVEGIKNEKDLVDYMKERESSHKLRSAIGFCKNLLEITAINDKNLKYEERMNFEKCMTENFLVKHGYDYFGKRDLIYVDLYGTDDVIKLKSV
jgi:hypothetical protein